MNDKLFQFGIALIFVIILAIGYSCIRMASEQERISEKDWEEFEEKHNKKHGDEEDSL